MFDYNSQPVNFVKGKRIVDMKAGETIYIQKSVGGFSHIYLCEFMSYERGIVKAKIIGLEEGKPWLKDDVGKTITARPTKCYLWGPRGEDVYIGGNCHWFKDGVVD